MKQNNNIDYDDYYDSQNKSERAMLNKNKGCAGTIVYLLTILLISIVLSVIALFVANDVFAFIKEDKDVIITVKENTKISKLSSELDKKGILNYGFIFKMFLFITDKDGEVLAGSYKLTPSMDYAQIVKNLKNSEKQETVTVTIPEGYTIAQIKKTLIENGVCTEDKINEALNTYPFKHEFLKSQLPPKANWLEGYLFPDTYTFYKNGNVVKDVVNKMLNNFDNRYDEDIITGASQLGISIDEAVIIASLIEREAKVPEEFAMISGVIHNRLKSSRFPYLEIDASLLYGLGRTNGVLSAQDLKTNTPYNTYMNKGLPPGPICNPGYNALYAATHPSQHGYYFYVAMPDGSHLFASSNSKHEQNKAKAAEAFAALKNNS